MILNIRVDHKTSDVEEMEHASGISRNLWLNWRLQGR